MKKRQQREKTFFRPQEFPMQESERRSAYWVWRGMFITYQGLSQDTHLRLDKKRRRYLRLQIALHYFKNFFFFPLWLVSFLIPSYFRGEKNVWTNLKTLLTSREFRPLRIAALSQLVFFIVLIQLGIVVFIDHKIPTFAATYGWVQTSWVGGASGTTAGHPSNQTGWTNYASGSLVNGSVSPGDLKLATSSYTFADDGTISSSGLGTGGGFGNGTLSSATLSGSGSAAEITLAVESAGGEVLQWDETGYSLPAAIGTTSGNDANGNGNMVSDGTYFYILRGNHTNNVYRFDPSTKTSVSLPNLPGVVPPVGGYGGAITLSGNYIYIYTGGSYNEHFYAYNITQGVSGTWQDLPLFDSLSGDGSGNGLVTDGAGNIFLTVGGTTNKLYKYTITAAPSGTWTTYTTSHNIGYGSRMIYDSDHNRIVVEPGNNGHCIIYMNIATTTPSEYCGTGANSDSGFVIGASVAKKGGDNRLFAFEGQNGGWLQVINPDAPSWSNRQTYSITGATVGSYMLSYGTEDRIYVAFGGSGNKFDYFKPSTVSGAGAVTMQMGLQKPIPGATGAGMTMIRHNADEIYVLAGGNSDQMYRFAINAGSQYYTSGTFTSASIDLKYTESPRISWSASIPGNAGANAVRFQVAANTDNATWNYVGPDGTASTYFTTSNTALPSSFTGKRYYRYKAFLSTTNASYTPTLQSVTLTYNSYVSSGTLISSPYDAGDASNVLASIAWTASTPTGTSVKFQVRTSSDNTSYTSWLGPDGTNSTYFTNASGGDSMPSAVTDGSDDEWIQYQVFLAGDGTATPVVSDVTMTYVVNAPPDIAITASTTQVSDGTVTVPYDVRDVDTTDGSTPGFVTVSLQYCTANCTSSGSETWQTAASSTLSGDSGAVSVDTNDTAAYTSHTLVWTPTSSYNNQYVASNFKVRLVANDGEAANNIAYDESNSFVLDTTDPVASLVIDGRSDASDTLTLSVTDDTTAGLQMKLSNNSDLSSDGVNQDSGSWVDYTETQSWNLGSGGTTVYYQVRDAYGNVSSAGAVSSVATPDIPQSMFIKDISNTSASEWREFIAWEIVDEPSPGFAQYTIYRSTDGSTYSALGTQTDRSVNYYMDPNLDNETTYYYKVVAEDDDGNISSYSSVVSDQPNGQGGSDATAPTISNVTTSTVTPQSFTVSWDTDEVSDSYVDYVTESGGDFSNATSVGVTSVRNTASGLGQHVVTLTGLSPETTYYFRVRSIDPEGNEGTSTLDPDGYSVTTVPGPSISDVSSVNVLNTEATITWATDEPSTSYVTFATNSSLTGSTRVGSDSDVSSHSVTLSGLSPNTMYYYLVESGVATDANVQNGQAQYYSFKTSYDSAAPVISLDTATDITVSASTIIIGFTTNEPATTTLRFGTSTAYGSTEANDNFNIDHQFSTGDLALGTEYFFEVTAADRNGNVSSPFTFSTTTIDTTDYDPPSISNVTTTVVTDDQALIVWDTDEVANSMVYYGTVSTTLSSSEFVATYNQAHAITLNNLTTSTEYYYHVVSADATGNTSTSTIQSFTTLEQLSEESEVLLREAQAAEAARQEGYTEGQAEGQQAGYDEGYAAGYDAGYDAGYEAGHDAGVEEGQDTGQEAAYQAGYDAGYDAGYAAGYDAGYEAGHDAGYDEGYAAGHDAGYEEGRSENRGGGGGGAIIINNGDPKDDIPPIASAASVRDITGVSAEVSWTTDEAGDSVVEFGKTREYGEASVRFDDTTDHQVRLIGLDPVTTYYYRVSTEDAHNNRSNYLTGTFRTTIIDIGDQFEIDPEGGQNSEQTFLATLERASELIRSMSTNVSLGVLESSLLQQTQLIKDLSSILPAPFIAGEPGFDIGSTYATISWGTDKESNSLVSFAPESVYQSTEAYDQTIGQPDESVTRHSVSLKNLLPNTLYNYQIKSKTPAGAETVSQNFTFRTKSQTSEIVSYKVESITDNTATFSWQTNVPTDSVISYTPYSNGSPNTEATRFVRDGVYGLTHSLAVPNLEAGQLYKIEFSGTDYGNNIVSKTLPEFTLDGTDVAPIVSQIKTEAAIIPGGKEKIQVIISWTTNELSTSQVYYNKGFSRDGETFAESTSLDGTYTTKHVMVVTNFEPGTIYQFQVESVDASGNATRSRAITFLTPQKEQSVFQVIFSNFEDIFSWVGRLK